MNLHLPSWRRPSTAVEVERPTARDGHVVESDFSPLICRFVLECSCGDRHDTRYIDEALEWRELHLALAPLADRLGSPA
jgi:hypothetical protein